MTGPIVPGYLNEDYRLLRAHLNRAAQYANLAAEASTLEEITKFLGASSMAMIDADFIRLKIARKALIDEQNKEKTDG